MTASMNHRLALALCLALPLAACRHTSGNTTFLRPGEEWVQIEPGKNYEGTVLGQYVVGDTFEVLKPARFRFVGQLGQRVTFRLHSDRKSFVARGATLTHVATDEEVEVTTIEPGKGEFTAASAILPASGEYTLEFTLGSPWERREDFRLEFLPGGATALVDLVEDQVVAGQLTADDPTDVHDTRYDLFRFRGDADDYRRLTFIVKPAPGAPAGFAPVMEIRAGDPNGREETTLGREEYTGAIKGDAWIQVRAYHDQPELELGPYTIEVHDARRHQMATMPVLELGRTATGRFEKSGRQSASFKVRGELDQIYVIEAKSDDFDVELMLHNNKPFSSEARGIMDKDGAGGTNARLVFKFPDTEEWALLVSVEDEDAVEGAYEVTFAKATKPPPGAPKTHEVPGVAKPVRELFDGQPVSARLDAGTGAPTYAGRDVYMFHGKEGQNLVLTLSSADFDGLLRLTQIGQATPLATARGKRGVMDAVLEMKLPARADYLIEVQSQSGEKGQYSIELK